MSQCYSPVIHMQSDSISCKQAANLWDNLCQRVLYSVAWDINQWSQCISLQNSWLTGYQFLKVGMEVGGLLWWFSRFHSTVGLIQLLPSSFPTSDIVEFEGRGLFVCGPLKLLRENGNNVKAESRCPLHAMYFCKLVKLLHLGQF